ncbi:unnamed protein product [Symbiodinium sp. CCMP2592]|nr:unnamed protein product [Symbiodinium sp. CCMP2592]
MAKQVGSREAINPVLQTGISRCVKRSYKRAYARSCREGGAFYRGTWRSHQWFQPTSFRTQSLPRLQPRQPKGRSLSTLTWNAGGLHASIFRELTTYLEDEGIDVCMVQETHWNYDANWSTPNFHFVHSSGQNKEDKHGGVLTIVSTKVATTLELQYHVLWPGRLLHVRVNKPQPIDILNAYQYTANDNPLTPARRHKYLLRLRHALSGIPNRHILVLAGDLNTTCVTTTKVCGKWVLPASDAHNKDNNDFMSILISYHLTALNTWNRPTHHQLATFTFGTLASQIDYIICRQADANNQAKQAAVVQHFPVASWREGANHHPVRAHIRIPHHTSSAPPIHKPPRIDVNRIIEDLKETEPPQALLTLRDCVDQGIQTEQWSTLPQLEAGLLKAAQELYPKRAHNDTHKEADLQLSHCARRMWAIFREMRSHPFNMHGVFQSWRQWAQFSKAHKEHKSRAKERSKAWRRDLILKAQQAAENHNMFQIWEVVKSLAPKSKRKKLQLYRNGHMMTPEAELDWIIEEFGNRYGARAPTTLPHIRQQAPVLIGPAEVWHQLEHLPVRKAVPAHMAPSILWKACSTEVSLFISQQVCQQWSSPVLHVQQEWADATVALLPKPTGKNDTPLSWRPIGLQHPVGKSIMKIIIAQAKDQIHALVRKWPQCAYVPNRSTTTALKRVFKHCATVRAACNQNRLNLHQLKAGAQPIRNYGGLQISMDLSAAFDLVSWTTIKEALEMAQIDPSIQEILLQWLSQVRYTFQHKGMEKDIWPSWGLRQGCIASPVLWAAFTALLSQAIDKRIEEKWSSDHSTMYADDTHLQWTFHSVQGFEQAVHELNKVIAVFRRLGMKVNTNKTKAILRLTGNMKHHIRKHYIRSHGQERRLLLSPGDPSGWIQLVDQAEYLGLIISYDNFELKSVKHRINKAHNRRWSLASVLHTKKVSIHYKLNLWRSCVLSTMLYALHSLCLGAGQICLLQRAIMRHIRAIISDQAFLTGHTHEDIMAKYHIQTAQELLERAHDRDQLNADSSDWLVDSEWNHSISKALLEAAQNKEPESDTEKAIWACPLCSEQFVTQAALKIHARRTHKIVAQRKNIFNRLTHSIGGLPQCAGCLKRFSKWQSLETHINTDACTAQATQDTGTTRDPPDPDDASDLRASQSAPEITSTPRKEDNNMQAEAMEQTAGVLCSETMIAPSLEGLQQNTGQQTIDSEIQHKQSIAENNGVTPTLLSDTSSQPTFSAEKQTTTASAANIPVLFQERVHLVVQRGLNAFIAESSLTASMQQSCALCGQWIASQKVVKTHYQHTHKFLYQQLAHKALKLIEQKATPNMAYGDPDWDEFFGEVQGDDLPTMNASPWNQQPMDNPFAFTGNKRRRDPFGEQRPVPQQNMRRHPFQAPPPRQPNRDPLLYTLAKTVLQQQEELKVLKQDTAMVLFLRPGEDSVLHHLYKVAAHFKAKQDQDATWQLGQNPLRMVLALALFKEVTDRLNQTIASQEKLKRAVDQGWRDPQAGWRYQVWNHKTRQLQVDSSRPPIPEDKLLDHFATILQCLRHPVVNRFRCIRRLAETMSSPATFKLDMSVRSHSALTMWDTLKMLQGNAVFQLAGMAYKTESLARGPMEQKIAEMIYGRR